RRRQLHRADVRGGRPRRPRQHPRRLRRRPRHRPRAVAHATRAALPAAEHGRLHRVPARALSSAPGPVRAPGAHGLMAARAQGWLAIAGVVAAGVVLTLVVQERYHHRVLTLVFLWAAMGLAWNIISGYAGQISFGHQVFFGIGAYVTVLLGVLAATLVLSRLIETSRLGYRLRAVKENEQAAEAMGVDAFRAKMAAYVLSAVPAAVVGAVYIHAILFIVTPDAVFGLLVISQ